MLKSDARAEIAIKIAALYVSLLLERYTEQTGLSPCRIAIRMMDVTGLGPDAPQRHTVVGCRVEVAA